MSAVAALLLVVPGHLGTLHGAEKALVLLLAFGPFVVLAIALRVAQRRNGGEDEDEVSARPPAT